jgi:PAS domain S-box-containing protein
MTDEISSLSHAGVQQSLLAQVVDTAPALVFVADEEMRYVAVNQTACDVLGYTRDELLRLRVTDVAASDEAPELYIEMLQNRGQTGTTPIRTKDGRLLRLHYKAGQTQIAGMHYFVSIGFVDGA